MQHLCSPNINGHLFRHFRNVMTNGANFLLKDLKRVPVFRLQTSEVPPDGMLQLGPRRRVLRLCTHVVYHLDQTAYIQTVIIFIQSKIQWTPSIPVTLGISESDLIRKVALFQGWIVLFRISFEVACT